MRSWSPWHLVFVVLLTVQAVAAHPQDGAWEDLGSAGPAGRLGGAWSGSSLLIHDPSTDAVWRYDGTWERIAPAQETPPAVRGSATGFAGGLLYSFGGETSGGGLSGELWSWSVGDGWQPVTAGAGPAPRTEASMGSDGTHLFLYGGRATEGLVGDAWRYTPANGTWTLLSCDADCPGPRARAALAVREGTLWLHGGVGPDGPTAALHRSLAGGGWEPVDTAPAPPPVAGHGLVTDADGLLAVGGCTTSGPLTWRYIPGQGWHQLHPTPPGRALEDGAVVFDGARVHLVGGVPCGPRLAAPPLHAALQVADGDRTRRFERLAPAAQDPVAIGVAVSQATFADGAASVAAVGTAERFPDSLAGTTLLWGAGRASGPLLFSGADALSGPTADELVRVVAPGGTVYLLGGAAALDEAVADDVAGLGLTPVRLSGPSRVETAVAVASEVERLRELVGGEDRVLLADARNFPDAIAAGGYAVARGPVPLLLTPGSEPELHPAVAEAMDDLAAGGVTEAVLLGGTAALSAGIAGELDARGFTVIRVAGSVRDGTAVAVGRQLWGRSEPGQGHAFVLTDFHSEAFAWAAALAAAPLAGTVAAPLLAANPAVDGLPSDTRDYLAQLGYGSERPGYAYVVGPLPTGVEADLEHLLGGSP